MSSPTFGANTPFNSPEVPFNGPGPFDGAPYDRPVPKLEIAFSGSSAAVGTMVVGGGQVGTQTGTWVQVTGVQEAHIQRGRQDELSKIEAGRATFVLDNTDGTFSPELQSSPFYPYVKPWRPIRFGLTFRGTYYPLFNGYIEDWYPVPGYEWQYVRVQCVDYMASLQNKKFLASTTLTQQGSGARINAILSAASFLGATDVATGTASIAGGTPGSTYTLQQHVEDVVFIEQGLFWMGRDGTAIFRDANARYTRSESTTSQATFGGASGLGFDSLEYDYSVRFIQNDVRVTRSGGTEQAVSDTASQVLYDVRTLQQTSQWLVNDSNALNLATLLLSQRKAPPEKVTALNLTLGGDDGLTLQALAREISDRITVVRTFPAFGLNRDFWIEGMQHDFTNGLEDWKLQWLLSSASAQSFGLVGSGVVGTMTVGIGI